jgi:hypothetical protein
MSYRLNKTNGDLVVELADGQIDTTSTDVTLVGRNYRGFGEVFNENFIKIIENFASTGAPDAPLKGQLWYDTNAQRLKIYNGTEFTTAGSPIVSSTQPGLVQGDLWIDNSNRKLYFYDGNVDGEITLVGPAYDNAQGKTGLEVESVIDISSQERVIIKMFIANNLFAVITDETFRLSGINKVEGYPDDENDVVFPARQLFEKGFNLVDPSYFYRGTAESARALVDADQNVKLAGDFLPSNSDATTVGTLTIKNSQGLSIGIGDIIFSQYKVIGNTTAIETQQSETDIALRTRVGNLFTTPLFADSSESKVGIFNTSPEFTLDVSGSLRASGNAIIDGDLTVNGSTTYINASTLQVQDKNIELGLLADGTAGVDTNIDGAGITAVSSQGSKTLAWQANTNSWTSNVNIDLTAGNEYKINGNKVLSSTELGPTVNTANGLSSIGTLTDLTVDNVTIDANVISTVTTGLVINASGDISVSNSAITDLESPTSANDAANKSYVDVQIDSIPVYLALDVSGLANPSISNPYNDVSDILDSIVPASEKEDGVVARIHTTAYNSFNVTGIDVESAISISRISVLSDDGTTAESVVQDLGFTNASGSGSLTPTRQTMIFQSSGADWIWQNTI